MRLARAQLPRFLAHLLFVCMRTNSMTRIYTCLLLALALGVVLPAVELRSDERPAIDAAHLEFFEAKIRPVLVKHCYECHSAEAEELEGGLALDSAAAVLAGGDSGPALVPGKPKESLLLDALNYGDIEMPPDGRLPKEVIADFERWIEMGAPDPRKGGQAPPVARRTIDIDEGRKFWAFQPVQPHAPPMSKNKEWPRTSIDAFVLAKLEEANLQPSDDADKATLIRRLYYDVIALPRRKNWTPRWATIPRKRLRSWSTACWPRSNSAYTGDVSGSTSPAMPTPTAAISTRPSTTPGGTATTSSPR